ncbi:MAG: aminotransferase class V-fold PLP-dependent enzyme [Armatimonadota bacterium]|jgi:cysteine desulfurase/selenocysteine lyase
MTGDRLSDEFPVREELIYLNHAAVCPIPRRTAAAVCAMAEEYRDRGSWDYPHILETVRRGRERLADLIGARAHEVAYVKNTTSGLMLAAESIPWREGDSVVVAEIEFPANVYPWLNLRRRGVEVRMVESGPDRILSVDDYRAACDGTTRAIAASWVQYSTGQRMEMAALAELARESGAYLIVDAIQGLGALEADVGEMGADILCADGHKWLLSVEGCGLMYVSDRVIGDLDAFWRGWTSVPDPMDFGAHDQPPRNDARRFEEGSGNILGAAALDASAGLLLEVGMAQVQRRIIELTDRLIEGLRAAGCEIASPSGPGRRSGIVCFRHPRDGAEEVVARLARERIAAASRLGVVRLSPHFYNDEGEIDRAFEAVAG